MFTLLRTILADIFDRLRTRRSGARKEKVVLGTRVKDGEVVRGSVAISSATRSMHVAVLGKTGTGKSSLLRHLCVQDIAADRGFLFFDLHGDTTAFLLKVIHARERQLRRHLSEKLVLVNPSDPYVSVGVNPLYQEGPPDFVRIGEFAEALKQRWGLDRFGARTDELLRNTLYALSANGLTLLEIAPFLSSRGFRIKCLQRIDNPEVRAYFEHRYDPVSDAMQAVMREPILNKTSAFTADPRFRHLVGQPRSTFSLRKALDEGYWVIVNLDKGRLGDQALTFGSLFFTMLKNALFGRSRRTLFTVFCDEIQNFVGFHGGIETLLAEARKFGVSFVTANQFLDQHPPELRAALLAVGTHAFFQLSSADAAQVAQAVEGGRQLGYRLKNLPPRRFVVKAGAERWQEAEVPMVFAPQIDFTDLLNRSRYRFGRARVIVEREITERRVKAERTPDELLHDWE